MNCPECDSTDYWEGINGHCPNHTCSRFDEKLLNKLLEEQHSPATEESWEDTTLPMGKMDPYCLTQTLPFSTDGWHPNTVMWIHRNWPELKKRTELVIANPTAWVKATYIGLIADLGTIDGVNTRLELRSTTCSYIEAILLNGAIFFNTDQKYIGLLNKLNER